MPMSTSACAASAWPATPSAPSPAAAPRSSSWKSGVLVRELQRVDQIALVRLAVDAEQADRRGDRRLRRSRRGALQRRPASRARACRRSSRAPAPHRPAAGHRAWRPRSARRTRTAPCSRRALRSPRCGRNLRRAATSRSSACRTRGSSRAGAPASARTSAGRTNSACSLSSAAMRLRDHRAIGIVLEEAVGDRAQPIVRAGERLAHRVAGARIVEAGQQHERAIAHVAVGLLGDRPAAAPERPARRRSAARSATRSCASRSRGRRACRSRPAAAPARRSAAPPAPARACRARHRDTEDTEDTEDAAATAQRRRRAAASASFGHLCVLASVSRRDRLSVVDWLLSSFSASCR